MSSRKALGMKLFSGDGVEDANSVFVDEVRGFKSYSQILSFKTPGIPFPLCLYLLTYPLLPLGYQWIWIPPNKL
jgi:hypothetical protein